MTIQVYGPGCSKCFSTGRNAREAVAKLGLDIEIEEIHDLNAMMAKGIMMTPAFGIDGKVLSSGKALTTEEIMEYIKKAMQ
ncbi:MAG: TM0996/MTH895 family glutaredoxin-like protein [Caldisericia bacterium]|nr:TM0996/MTH895 family glutaredoxin-like protein [Caldisericia bacterium]